MVRSIFDTKGIPYFRLCLGYLKQSPVYDTDSFNFDWVIYKNEQYLPLSKIQF